MWGAPVNTISLDFHILVIVFQQLSSFEKSFTQIAKIEVHCLSDNHVQG